MPIHGWSMLMPWIRGSSQATWQTQHGWRRCGLPGPGDVWPNDDLAIVVHRPPFQSRAMPLKRPDLLALGSHVHDCICRAAMGHRKAFRATSSLVGESFRASDDGTLHPSSVCVTSRRRPQVHPWSSLRMPGRATTALKHAPSWGLAEGTSLLTAYGNCLLLDGRRHQRTKPADSARCSALPLVSANSPAVWKTRGDLQQFESTLRATK